MTKGKPWNIEDEKNLKEWLKLGVNLDCLTLSFEGKYSKNAIYQKMIDLNLKVKEKEEAPNHQLFSSNDMKLCKPEDLPSIEQALKTLSAALKLLETPALPTTETFRLKTIIQGLKIYKELFEDFVDYCGIEKELAEATKKYAEILKKMQTPQPK